MMGGVARRGRTDGHLQWPLYELSHIVHDTQYSRVQTSFFEISTDCIDEKVTCLLLGMQLVLSLCDM